MRAGSCTSDVSGPARLGLAWPSPARHGLGVPTFTISRLAVGDVQSPCEAGRALRAVELLLELLVGGSDRLVGAAPERRTLCAVVARPARRLTSLPWARP